MMTRRSVVLMGLGLGGAVALPAWAKDFWNDKKAADWTDDEVQQMLNRSPWAKEASIFDSAAHKGLSSAPRTAGLGRRSGGRTSTPGSPAPLPGSPAAWKAIVRWESALPVREAVKAPNKDAAENYIIALIGDIPGVGVPSDDDEPSERRQKMDNLKESTRLERRDDPLELQQVKSAPKTPLSPAGTWFYFSRVLPITPDDKQVTFVTKVGPLEVKCKFTLRDMLYRGNLEL